MSVIDELGLIITSESLADNIVLLSILELNVELSNDNELLEHNKTRSSVNLL